MCLPCQGNGVYGDAHAESGRKRLQHRRGPEGNTQKRPGERELRQFAFGLDWDNPELYDMVLNMDNLTPELATDTVLYVARTEEIMARSIDAMKSLLNDGPCQKGGGRPHRGRRILPGFRFRHGAGQGSTHRGLWRANRSKRKQSRF